MLYAGHSGFSNYASRMGMVKALKPYATVGPNDGGSGQVNMWTIDNVDFSVVLRQCCRQSKIT